MSGIYKITCLGNNKCYIGSSLDVKTRISIHKYSLRYNRHQNKYLQRAWNKYGEDNFTFEIIEYLDIGLQEREKELILQYNSLSTADGFNMKLPGYTGIGASNEVKSKLSLIRKGKKLTDQTKKRISEANKGKKRTQEFKDKISMLNSGRILTEEHKRKLRINSPNKKLSDENILEILQLIKNGMSNRNISKIYNVTETRISEIKHNKRFKHVKRPS